MSRQVQYKNVLFNSQVVPYEGYIKLTKGSISRTYNPQVNGAAIITSNIETNMSELKISIRSTPQNDEFMDDFFNNGTNNVVQIDDEIMTSAHLEVLPEREDQQLVEYVIKGDPIV